MKNDQSILPLILMFIVMLGMRSCDTPTPEPGPDPQPDPQPTPDVDPAPFPSDGLSVLIVEETSKRNQLPSSQLSILMSTQVRDFVEGSGGEIRVLDKDVDAQYAAEKWRLALRKPRDSLPWILISNRETGYSGPLPQTIEDTTELIGKYK